MRRSLYLSFSIFVYAVFLVTLLFAMGFVGNYVVPNPIDGNAPNDPAFAIMVDVMLLSLFGIQQHLLTTDSFKRFHKKICPPELERSSLILLTSICLIFLMICWQPLGVVIWSVDTVSAKGLLLSVYIAGWTIVFMSTFFINHFELLGVKQAYDHFHQRVHIPQEHKLPECYNIVRDPVYFGLLIIFWSSSNMTVAHLLLALVLTVHVLSTVALGKRDLLHEFFLDISRGGPSISLRDHAAASSVRSEKQLA